MVFIRHELHTLHEVVAEEVFGDVQALKLVHSLNLLLSLDASVIKGLILNLDPLYLSLDL